MRGYNFKMGCLSVKVKYLLSKPSGLFYFRRGIPQDLRHLYGGKTEVILSLKTSVEKEAISRCQKLSIRYDDEFQHLRVSGDREKAVALLDGYGLEATNVNEQPNSSQLDNDGHPYNQFIEDLSLKYDIGPRQEAASFEQRALDILHGDERITLAEIEVDALKSIAVRAGREIELNKKRLELKRYFKHFNDRLSVVQIDLIRRKMVQKAVEEMLGSGLKTGTVKKILVTVRKHVRRAISHYELSIINPFDDVEIRGIGLDVSKKSTFSAVQLVEVKSFIKQSMYLTTVQLLGLLVDTGTRCGEVGGILLDDIRLDHKFPHMVYKAANNRSVKTAASTRVMPLVGLSLEVAKSIKDNAEVGQVYAFPQWSKSGEFNHTSCNNAVNALLQTRFSGFSTHCFRHTMTDRLKEANVRGELIRAICGWAGQGMDDYYGQTDRLEVLSGALEQVLEREGSV